jgi:hypothetical protein
VLAASKFVDTNVKTVPLLPNVIVPGTGTAPAETTTASLPTLSALKGALIAKSTRTFAGTLFAPFAGLTIRTVGADVSVAALVVKFDAKDASPCPSTSAIPPVACT